MRPERHDDRAEHHRRDHLARAGHRPGGLPRRPRHLGRLSLRRCDAWTTDRSGLVSYQATAEDPGAHVILDVVLSEEPLGPLTPQSDEQFAEIVRWTIFGLITAEEYGITSENIDDFLTSESPDVQRFLGLNDNPSGSYLGIANDFMVNVIRQVGNYGEIYARHLGVAPFNLARGVNALWTDGGLLYAPPFR